MDENEKQIRKLERELKEYRKAFGFAVFAGDDHYPAGGWGDCRGVFATEDEAREKVASTQCDWWHLVDLTVGTEIDAGLGAPIRT